MCIDKCYFRNGYIRHTFVTFSTSFTRCVGEIFLGNLVGVEVNSVRLLVPKEVQAQEIEPEVVRVDSVNKHYDGNVGTMPIAMLSYGHKL